MRKILHDGFVNLEPWKSAKFWVTATVTKPVSYIVKGLRSRDFKDEQRNRMTIRASLPTGRQAYPYRGTKPIF
jgi:hypothetical protein